MAKTNAVLVRSKEDREFGEWFDKNLLYCQGTHSFLHRLAKKLESHLKDVSLLEVREKAFDVIEEMREEFKYRRAMKKDLHCPKCGKKMKDLVPVASRRSSTNDSYDFYCNNCGTSGDVDIDKKLED